MNGQDITVAIRRRLFSGWSEEMKKGLHSQAPSCIIYLERYSESNLRVPSVKMLKEFKHLIFARERMLISFCYNDCLKTTQPQKLLTIKSRLPLCS